MDVQRELGTYFGDLPHQFERAGDGRFCKHCGLAELDPLHAEHARETAAHRSQPLPRELGS